MEKHALKERVRQGKLSASEALGDLRARSVTDPTVGPLALTSRTFRWLQKRASVRAPKEST